VTSDQLSALAGVALSLAFSYLPGLREWFAGLDGVRKRLFMAAMLLAISVSVFGLSCAGALAGPGVPCEKRGALDLLWAFVAALVANQATFHISPQVAQK